MFYIQSNGNQTISFMDPLFSGIEISPRRQARIAGLLYLIVDLTAGFAMLVRSQLIVHGDAAATAANILTHEFRFRLAFSAELAACVINIPLAVIFLYLFKVVNKQLALIVMLLIVGGSILQAAVLLNQYAPLIDLTGHYMGVFREKQLQAQAYAYLDLQNAGLAAAMVFFGCYCLTTGYLIMKSTFMPRIIGVLLVIEALTYLSDSFAVFLAPALAPAIFHILMFAGFAEIIFCLWLLVMGVDSKKWYEQAKAMGYRIPGSRPDVSEV